MCGRRCTDIDFSKSTPPPINPQGYFLYINLGIRPNSNFRFRAENKAKFREPQLREKKAIDLQFFLTVANSKYTVDSFQDTETKEHIFMNELVITSHKKMHLGGFELGPFGPIV